MGKRLQPLLNSHVVRGATFRLEGEVAELADVRPDVGVRPDVFLQHAGLLAADAALLADVLPPAATTDVNVVLVGFVPRKKKKERAADDEGSLERLQCLVHALQKPPLLFLNI